MTLPEYGYSGSVLISRTIVMDDGRIIANGLTMEILEDEELLDAHELESG
jgi:ABC-type hemin transport system ATPase subunit